MDNIMDNEQYQGESFSKKEQELITQLINIRKEQKQDLPFENLDGYEVPPRTQFSMLKKPAVTLKVTKMDFNCAAIRLFAGITLVLPIFNRDKKRLAAVPCSEEESATVEWSRLKNDAYISKTITSPDYVEKIFEIMNWDRTCRYKALGRLAQTERGLVLIFDLQEAIMFAPKPVEYIDKITGQTKKRQVKYYPDEYKYKIGKSYNDYVAFQQQSLFENLEEYTETTQGSTIQENGGSNDQSRNE